jgi:hypothetical protein
MSSVASDIGSQNGRKLRQAWSKTWAAIRPGPEARKGALWGAVALAGITAVVASLDVKLGFGLWFDLLFCFTVAGLALLAGGLVVALLLTILRKLPRFVSGIILASCVLTATLLPPPAGIILGIGAGLAQCLLGAAIATFWTGGFQRAALSKKIIIVSLCVLAVGVNAAIVVLFASSGTLP